MVEIAISMLVFMVKNNLFSSEVYKEIVQTEVFQIFSAQKSSTKKKYTKTSLMVDQIINYVLMSRTVNHNENSYQANITCDVPQLLWPYFHHMQEQKYHSLVRQGNPMLPSERNDFGRTEGPMVPTVFPF